MSRKIAMIGAGGVVFCKTLMSDIMANPALAGSQFALMSRSEPNTPPRGGVPTMLDGRVVVPSRPAEVSVAGAQQIILEKNTLNLFENPNISRLLEALQADEYVVYGVVTEYCVRHAALGLLDTGKPITLSTDAVETLKREDRVHLTRVHRAPGEIGDRRADLRGVECRVAGYRVHSGDRRRLRNATRRVVAIPEPRHRRGVSSAPRHAAPRPRSKTTLPTTCGSGSSMNGSKPARSLVATASFGYPTTAAPRRHSGALVRRALREIAIAISQP